MNNPDQKHRFTRWGSLALAVATALLASVATSTAQVQIPTNNFVFTFETNAPWWGWFGVNLNNNIQTWDATMDGSSNANSGSCKLTFPYNYDGGATATVSGRAVTFGNFNLNTGNQYGTGTLLNGRYFRRLTAKIRVAPNTPLRQGANDFGNIQFNLLLSGTPNGGNNPYGGNIVIPAAASNSWVTITQAVDQLQFPYESPGCMGIVFTKNSQGTANSASQYPSNTFELWIDDVTAELSPTGAPDFPPPTLSLGRSDVTGLSVSPLTGANNVRALIRTTGDARNIWWMDNPSPMTYSMGIADMPANGSYQAHIFLNPDGSTGTAPDFSDANNIFLDIRRNANGTGSGTFRVKTNEPNGNAMTYFQGAYAAAALTNGNVNQTRNISTPTALGTWGLTFQNNTNITMFGPGGVSTNFNVPVDLANMFRPNAAMVAYFGDQNNNAADVALAMIITNVTISVGNSNIINDKFPPLYGASEVDPAVWARSSGGSLAGISVLTNTGWLVSWTTTDFGFAPQYSTNLSTPWLESDAITLPTTAGTFRRLLLSYTVLPTSQSSFRLEKRTGTKLLVLLPGESFAPGTATGKTGTPTIQAAVTPFPVRVIAVNAQFKRAGGFVDNIHLVDSGSIMVDGVTGAAVANRAMVDSVATFNVMTISSGNITITASDLTDPTKVDGTSSTLVSQ